MTDVRMEVPGTVEEVFAVLADGWSYGHWVVGSTHIRDVDADWPQVGSRIHHSVGAWPVTVQQATTVRAVDPPHSIELDAQLWPLGVAWIRMAMNPIDADTTEVTMSEKLIRGPGRLVPGPVQSLALVPRNKESLNRLCELVAAHYGS
ncbi:SRPBCC family protein [Nocardia veterana]|uniref:SRPBCC family protein n=1 Tax=Nocardia veterana TaxID=132249 RepID=A0A7X6M134_9NOCA|nr:SRPBCC family protein [Nocardia veterana]NKY87387.1 SRPBCC family protein [Nocardia veterana]